MLTAEQREALEALLEDVIQAIARPDKGDGQAWWVGLDLGPHGGFWDTSCPTERAAHACARSCRELLLRRIVAAISEED